MCEIDTDSRNLPNGSACDFNWVQTTCEQTIIKFVYLTGFSIYQERKNVQIRSSATTKWHKMQYPPRDLTAQDHNRCEDQRVRPGIEIPRGMDLQIKCHPLDCMD